MAANAERLQEAINRLGFFTGEIGQHQFIARLLNMAAASNGNDGTTSSAEWNAAHGSLEVAEGGPFEELITSLLNLTDGGISLQKFTADVAAFIAGADGFEEAIADKIDSTESRLFTIWTEETAGNYTGEIKITDMVGAAAGVNTQPDNPTKENPNLGCMIFHDPALNFSNRDSGAVGVFLNMLPSTELSKCIPFIDVKLVTAEKPVEVTDTGSGTVAKIGNGISLLRFLKGKTEVEENNPFAVAQPKGVSGANEIITDEDGTPQYDEHGQVQYKTKPITVAGMEIFTSPQTLVNADEPHYDVGPYGERKVGGTTVDLGPGTAPGRQAPIHDKFRPFMSLKSFSMKIAPTRGLMSTKTCEVGFILHDKSRLSEISQLVKPDALGDTEVLVEYGWNHPEAGQEPRNEYAELINAMRAKEKFGITKSSFSFDNVGQVDIKTNLISKGTQSVRFRMITDKDIAEGMDSLTVLMKQMRVLKNQIRGDLGENQEIVGKDTLGKANSVGALMSMDKETEKEIKALISRLQGNSGDYGELGDKLASAVGSAQNLQTAIAKYYTDTFAKVKNKPDPFILHNEPNNIKVVGTGTSRWSKNHVSFARIALEFIGAPLASTGRFDDVQLVFYPLGSWSSFARNDTVGSFPINKTTFEKQIKEKLKTAANLTIGQFLGFMNSTFFTDSACDAYGFGSIYERDPETGKAKLRKAYAEGGKKEMKLGSEKKKILRKAYGPNSDVKFRRPSIEMYMEAVPFEDDEEKTILRIHFFDRNCTSYSGFAAMWDSLRSSMASLINQAVVGYDNAEGNGSNATEAAENAAMRANHTANFMNQFAMLADMNLLEVVTESGDAFDLSEIETAYGSDTDAHEAIIAQLQNSYARIKGGPAGLKYLFHRNMPSIKYGQESSAVLSAKLQTESDSKMSTIHMQRMGQGTSGPAGEKDDGLPMQTFPSKLDLEMYGCPLINFGQQYFVDFMTGTTVDDIYVVTGIEHKFAPGEFKTTVKMTPTNKAGTFRSMMGNITKMMTEVAQMAADSSDPATTP